MTLSVRPDPRDPSAWPDELPRHGAKNLAALATCACGRATWVRYGADYFCRPCARYFAWGAQPGEYGQPTTPDDGAPPSPPTLRVVPKPEPDGPEW